MSAAEPYNRIDDPLHQALTCADNTADTIRTLTAVVATVETAPDLRALLHRVHDLANQVAFLRRSIARREAGLPDPTGGAA